MAETQDKRSENSGRKYDKKMKPFLVDASITKTAAFFFAQPHGWVAVGREVGHKNCRDAVLDCPFTSDYRKSHGYVFS